MLRLRRPQLGLPQSVVPIFWALILIESAYGAYLGILPLWIEKLGAPIAIVGLLLGANGILRLFVLFPSANIANRFGYRRTIMAARVAALIGLVAAALATHWQQLIVLIIGIAIGEIVFPLLQTLVAAEAGEQRMRAFALIFTVGPSVALAIGPIIAGVLVAVAGMRAAFLLAAVLTAASFYWLRKIEEPASHKARDLSQQSGYREAIADDRIRTITLLLLGVVFTCSLGVAFIPTFLEDVRGYQPASIATFSALGAVGSALFGMAVARTRKLQKEPFLAVAISLGMIVISLMLFHASALLPVILFAYLLRGGFFSAWAMLNASLGVNAPARHRARGFAIVEMAGGLASSFGPIVGGVLYARRNTLTFEVAIVLGLCLIPVILWVNRTARAWPHPDAELPVPIEDEPIIGDIPEVAPEILPEAAPDLQPVVTGSES
ncbi:MAG: MFS transporter [Thermomicrobiales bacterium]|nr:MAG: MFS transporter [Thermomicrobiales bacterium]